jgi:hypothetical protein
VKGIDTKYGQRAATCAGSIMATVSTKRDVLASIEPMAQAAQRLLQQEMSNDIVVEVEYQFGRIEEFISKWRPSANPSSGYLYIQHNWAESIDTEAQTARRLIRDLAKDFADGKFRQDSQISKLAFTTPIDKGKAFVAMAIDATNPSLEDVLDTIRAACEECGIRAKRIDEDQSNDRITDRIVENVRTAEFVIVDLTLARPNVFFEAGFAHGLGKTPIYIARHDTKPEFDIKDYPIIFFRNMRELRTGLVARLKALSILHEGERDDQ